MSSLQINRTAILWLDCLGALSVGTLVLLFSSFLSELGGLTVQVVSGLGIANLVYGTCSLFITLSRPRRLGLIRLLALSNMAWLVVCISLAVVYHSAVTGLGLVHLLGEGIYVAGLGYTEWRWQRSLTSSGKEGS